MQSGLGRGLEGSGQRRGAYTQALGVWAPRSRGLLCRARTDGARDKWLLPTYELKAFHFWPSGLSRSLTCPGQWASCDTISGWPLGPAATHRINAPSPSEAAAWLPELSAAPVSEMAHPCSEDLTGSLCPRLSDGPSVRGPQRVAGSTHSPSPTCLPLDRPPASQVKAEALASHCLGHSSQSSLQTAPGLCPQGTCQHAVHSRCPQTPRGWAEAGIRPHRLLDRQVMSLQGTGPCSAGLITSPREHALCPEVGQGCPTRRLSILRWHQREFHKPDLEPFIFFN